MKKLILILFCFPLFSLAQQTYVPDDNFEQALVNLGYDNILDDYVTTTNINTVTNLDVSYQSISDLTGIEDFTALTGLWCEHNQLISLDVSTNTALTDLECYYNQLTILDVSNNPALIELHCAHNQLTSLDVSQNTALTHLRCHDNQLNSLDVSGATALTWLNCRDNQLTTLDVSNNLALNYFRCNDNELTSLDVRSGNNTNIGGAFYAQNNDSLICIDVDDPVYSTVNWGSIDPWAGFSGNCQNQIYGCTDPTAANYNQFSSIDDSTCIYGCFLPDSIWISDITHNSFTVSFNTIVNANATQYRVKYKETTSNTWITKYGASSPITIENLSVATIYDYKFRTTCGSVGNSSWSPVYQVTTLDIMGCMDDRAINYNSLATADDGSCNLSCLKQRWAKHLNDQYLYYDGQEATGDLKTLNNDISISLNQISSSNFSFYDNVISDPSGSGKFLVSSISAADSLNWMIYPSSIGGGGGEVTIASSSSYNRYGISNPSVNPFSSYSPYNPNIAISKNNEIAIPIVISSVSSFNLGLQTFTPSPNTSQMGFGGIEGLCMAKINSNGDVGFLVTINESGGLEREADVAFDDYNNVYVTARCFGEDLFVGAQLPGSPQIAEFAYLTKLDYSGNPLFIKKFYDPIGTSTSVPFVGQGFDVPIPSGKMIITDNSLYLPLLLRDTVLLIDGDTTINVSSTSNIYFPNLPDVILNYVLLEFTLTGDFVKLHQNLDYTPHIYFENKFLSYRTDTIFELDIANLSVVGTHIYPGLSNVQINDDKMILTIGSEMLIVDDNFNTIDTIALVGLYNNGAVYIHNDGGLLGDTIITATGLNIAKYDIYPINPSQQPVTCSEWMDGAVSVNPNLGIPPYTYQWSTGDNTAQVDQVGMGTYSVTVTDSIGCVITDSVSVELDVAPSDSMHPQICYVTVDVNTGFNKIVLKPLESSSTSQYVIYKEGSATVYSPLDTIDANTLEYIDINSNPAVQANRYKVSAIDVCGNPSDTSDHHKTVHLTMNTGTNGEVNLIWNIYEGYQVSDYLIYRGNSVSNMNMIGTIAGNLSSFTDQGPPTGNLEYQIRAIGQVCNPLPNAFTLPDTLESNVITHLNEVSIGVGFFTQDPTCPTCNDGYAIASAYGGIAPYTYFWTNGTPGAFLGGLPAGTYTVIAFDNAGNQASESVTLGASGPVLGCTDMAATNYDASATVDDGSCTYTVCNEDAPTGLFIDGIIHSRAVINWDNMNSSTCTVDQYRIRFRDVGTSSWTQKTMGGPIGSCTWGNQRIDKLLLGLTGSTTYEYQMKAWYCGGGASSWTGLSTFTTADNCPNVGNLTAVGATTTKATFTWDASNGAYEFVRLKSRIDSISEPDGSDWFQIGGSGVSYGTFTKNKNGLVPGETYRAQARAFCDPNGGAYFSLSWTPLVYWTQPVVRVEGGTAIANLAIYPTPSRDVFNISFTSETVQNLKVRVLNVIGEELMADDLQQFIGEYTKQINLYENAKGIYFLEIETNDGVVNKKLILQ